MYSLSDTLGFLRPISLPLPASFLSHNLSVPCIAVLYRKRHHSCDSEEDQQLRPQAKRSGGGPSLLVSDLDSEVRHTHRLWVCSWLSDKSWRLLPYNVKLAAFLQIEHVSWDHIQCAAVRKSSDRLYSQAVHPSVKLLFRLQLCSVFAVFQQWQQQWDQQSRESNSGHHQTMHTQPKQLHHPGPRQPKARRLCQLLAARFPWWWKKCLIWLHQQSPEGGALQQSADQRPTRLDMTVTSGPRPTLPPDHFVPHPSVSTLLAWWCLPESLNNTMGSGVRRWCVGNRVATVWDFHCLWKYHGITKFLSLLLLITTLKVFFIGWNVRGMITFSCRTIAQDVLWKQHTAATPLGRFMDSGLIPTSTCTICQDHKHIRLSMAQPLWFSVQYRCVRVDLCVCVCVCMHPVHFMKRSPSLYMRASMRGHFHWC